MNKRTEKTQESYYYEKLRIEIWKKAIGNDTISKGNHYYEMISIAILRETEFSLNKDTIRNFLEQKHTPSPKTLDIYSTYILGSDTNNPKTFIDFQNWHVSKATHFKLTDYFKKDKYRYFIILGGIGIIIFLVTLVLANQASIPKNEILNKNQKIVQSAKVSLLKEELPTAKLIHTLYKDFSFDNKEKANDSEAKKLLEWLGAKNIQYEESRIEPSYSGYLDNGCLLSVFIGSKGAKDTYGIQCNCDSTYPTSDPFYTEIIKPKETISFYKRFYTSDLEDLKKDNWFLFKDSIDMNLWNNPKYSNSGYLTLETLSGGPFLDNINYKPLTINIPSHSITCGSCCEIYVKIVNFNPSQRYQQAGFFIFYNDTPIPSLSYVFVGVTDSLWQEGQNHIQSVKRDGEYSNHHLIPGDKRSIVSKIEKGIIKNPVDSVIFKMVITNDEYAFLYKTNKNNYIPVRSKKLNLPEPKYIGLTAFQGRPELPYPIYPIADVIPAHFEYVRLVPCKD